MAGSEHATDTDSVRERARAQPSTERRVLSELNERRLGNRATAALLHGLPVGGPLSRPSPPPPSPPPSPPPAPPTGGRPIEPAVRVQMEASFGQDFSAVRVHTDASSGDSADQLGAKAYTVADDIVFGPGRYAPDTQVGHVLLAHELSHVLQQRRGISSGGDSDAEAEARQVGARSAAGDHLSVTAAGTGGAQLDPKDDDDPVLRAFQKEQQKKDNPTIGSPEWIRRFKGSPSAPTTEAPAKPGDNAHSSPPKAADPRKFVHKPFTKAEADKLRAWAETPRTDGPKPSTPNAPQAPAGEPRSQWLALLSIAADLGRFELEMRIRAIVPERFFVFGQARRGFVACMTGAPLQPPTDEFDLKEWERGEQVAALVIAADMVAGGIPPTGGGGIGGPAPAFAGDGRLRAAPAPLRPAGPPALESRGQSSAPATAAATAKGPAVAPGGAPAPQSEDERRAQVARNPSDKTAPTKPGETPAQAKERTDAALRKFKESGGKVEEIVGKVEEHHVVTNKTENSPAANESKQVLENARTEPNQPDLLTSDANTVDVENHGEAHGENYHVIVRNRLVRAVNGLTPRTQAYRDAVINELKSLKHDCQTAGTELNLMTIKRSAGGKR